MTREYYRSVTHPIWRTKTTEDLEAIKVRFLRNAVGSDRPYGLLMASLVDELLAERTHEHTSQS